MSKHIQAYFQTEDDAFAVNTKLQGYGLEQLEVSKVPENIGGDRNILVPLGAGLSPGSASVSGGTGGGPGGAGISGGGGTGPIVGGGVIPAAPSSNERDSRKLYDGDRNHFQYVLSAKVKDELHDEVIDMIRNNKGYVEVFE
ncbi:MAG: hypothetical protein H7X86_04485 [Gorillibacterium sp.]|nr:hypothetical protein [Gorillibacterium sp.]